MGDDREARIRERAYQIWEEEGQPEGRGNEHWAQAEREISEAPDSLDAGETAQDPGAATKPAAAV